MTTFEIKLAFSSPIFIFRNGLFCIIVIGILPTFNLFLKILATRLLIAFPTAMVACNIIFCFYCSCFVVLHQTLCCASSLTILFPLISSVIIETLTPSHVRLELLDAVHSYFDNPSLCHSIFQSRTIMIGFGIDHSQPKINSEVKAFHF